MKKILKVEGMTCKHCVKRVMKLIRNVPGVTAVRVSLEKSQAEFDCGPAVTDIEGIFKAINESGYSAAEK